MCQFYIPITTTDIELHFHALLTRDYMSSRSSFAQILSKPELNQSRPHCLPFCWALGLRLGLNGLKPASRLRDVVLGKKTVFGIELTGVRDAGLSWKKSGNTGSRSYFQTPFFSKCIRTCFFLNHVFSSVSITVVPREIEDNGYAKFGG